MATPDGKPGPKQAGVLPIRPAQTHGPADSSRSAKSKAAAQDGIKAKVRRLPPGLTELEFLTILGDPWKPGNGKVGWFSYHNGHTPKRYVDREHASRDNAAADSVLLIQRLQGFHARIRLPPSQRRGPRGPRPGCPERYLGGRKGHLQQPFSCRPALR